MDVLKQLGAFFGWLSGLVAGISAGLFAFGFVATIANQRLLGLTWSNIARDALWYPGLGSQVFVNWALNAILVLILLVLLAEALRSILRRARASGRPRIAAAAAAVARRRGSVLAVLAVGGIAAIGNHLSAPLEVTGLLFLPPSELCREPASTAAILAGADGTALARRLQQVAFWTAATLGIVGYALPSMVANRVAPVPLLVLGVAGIQALAAIPFAYGAMGIEPSLRALAVSADASPPGGLAGGRLFLLAGARDGLWIWEPGARSVHWLSGTAFRHMQIGQKAMIFDIACSAAEE